MTNAVEVFHPPEVASDRDDDDNSYDDTVDKWGRQSFPASDPPQNW